MHDDPWLRWQALSFAYPDRHVLGDATGAIGRGLHWLQGANGSGKSTLLKLLAGVLQPTLGTVALQVSPGCWCDPAADDLLARRELFWCGPGPVAFDHLSPREYLAWLATLYPRFEPARAAMLAPALGLSPFLDRRLATLSSGTQRKVALLAALAAGTRVRLVDEPFNALDAAAREVLAKALAQQAPQAAWLVASHEWAGPAAPVARLQLEQARVTPL